ncbi:glycosyltransferase [Desulfobacula toluolica]|uniref:Predicted glycosyl transferase, family 2 n=1 Tax=Desulfobacula toluolica (strain DSM 7467 / Tol2) TaxID=651182 RepID=K0NNG3_DESTT|nr:glycosyltransferase [Desulfobacula toluolica]CCK80302.1 predicted glycosyl transferase, family 2 [Desulfobacula toluolica Tol2]
MHNKVSIIIPTYNYGDFLSASIDSVLKQTYQNMEIIVIDDGSTDNTRQIVDSYKDQIKYIYQENSGLSTARNTGIKHATGEYMLFLDADDLLGVNLIQSQVEYLTNNPEINISVCRNRLFHKTDASDSPKSFGSWRLFKRNLDIHLCHLNIAPPHAFFFKSKIIKNSKGFDTTLTACEDYDLWIRLSIEGHIPYYNPKGMVYYRRHPKSMSSNLKNQYHHDVILHERVMDLLKKNSKFPLGKRFEGLLAFSSGVVRTAFLLNKLNLPNDFKLMKLAYMSINEAIKKFQKIIPDVLFLLFYFRIKSFLVHPDFKNVKYSKEISHNLDELIKGTCDSALNRKCLIKSIIGLLTKPNIDVWEKRELFIYIFHYLKNICVSLIKYNKSNKTI